MHSKSKSLNLLPYSLKVKILQGLQLYGILTAQARLLPDFLIIGAQRSGTSSLYADLIQHPYVRSALRKEVHFFNTHYQKGTLWYRSNFPPIFLKALKPQLITGEASPDYLIHPHTAGRIFKLRSSIKLIALLRNPVDRAYSHYWHEVAIGTEFIPFEQAVDLEEDRLKGEIEKVRLEQDYISFNYQHFSYLARGRYLEQLKNWAIYFNSSQLLILRSESFFTHPEVSYKKVLSFLGLPVWMPKVFNKLHHVRYPELQPQTREYLAKYFEPFNHQLYQYLGEDFGWEQTT